jgi:hypothetical protein
MTDHRQQRLCLDHEYPQARTKPDYPPDCSAGACDPVDPADPGVEEAADGTGRDAGWSDDRLLLTRNSFLQLTATRESHRNGIPIHLQTHEDLLIRRQPPSGKRSCDRDRSIGGPHGC